MIWWKYSIATTYFNKGGIDTMNLPQRIIGQWECILGFIVNYHPPPYNNNVMITIQACVPITKMMRVNFIILRTLTATCKS